MLGESKKRDSSLLCERPCVNGIFFLNLRSSEPECVKPNEIENIILMRESENFEQHRFLSFYFLFTWLFLPHSLASLSLTRLPLICLDDRDSRFFVLSLEGTTK